GRHALRLEDDLVLPRPDVGGIRRAPGPVGGVGADAAGVEVGEADAGGVPRPGRIAGLVAAVDRGPGTAAPGPLDSGAGDGRRARRGRRRPPGWSRRRRPARRATPP